MFPVFLTNHQCLPRKASCAALGPGHSRRICTSGCALRVVPGHRMWQSHPKGRSSRTLGSGTLPGKQGSRRSVGLRGPFRRMHVDGLLPCRSESLRISGQERVERCREQTTQEPQAAIPPPPCRDPTEPHQKHPPHPFPPRDRAGKEATSRGCDGGRGTEVPQPPSAFSLYSYLATTPVGRPNPQVDTIHIHILLNHLKVRCRLRVS